MMRLRMVLRLWEILITAKGCRRTELLNIVMSAAVTNSWQNEVDSIEMNILGGCNDLRRTIPCPYWYAKSGNPPDCCYSNSVDNHYYREWKAKNLVGYNEAYKYHCCYGCFGAKAAPVSKVEKNR